MNSEEAPTNLPFVDIDSPALEEEPTGFGLEQEEDMMEDNSSANEEATAEPVSHPVAMDGIRVAVRRQPPEKPRPKSRIVAEFASVPPIVQGEAEEEQHSEEVVTREVSAPEESVDQDGSFSLPQSEPSPMALRTATSIDIKPPSSEKPSQVGDIVEEKIDVVSRDVSDVAQQPTKQERGNKGLWRLPKRWSSMVIAMGVVVAVGFGYYLFDGRAVDPQAAVGTATEAPELSEREALLQAVSQLVALPPNESPTIATIADLEPLQGQDFFVNAKVGFKVLIYTEAGKAFLYDPDANLVVNVAPVILTDVPADGEVLQEGFEGSLPSTEETVPRAGLPTTSSE